MRMKQTARIISTYAADVSGVNSALFELGGMCVMHDASGCNSTYNTHDEPRWYDQDSLVFLSGLTEMEAVMGDDEKLIADICTAANQLHPKFIAISGTPVPMMAGTDFKAIASVVERRTGIPAFGFPTNGMHTYVQGASMALAAIADRFVTEHREKTESLSINLLGVTPLDFSVNGSAAHMKTAFAARGIPVVSSWAMGDTLEDLQNAPSAHVNLVVSAAGLGAANCMRERFGIPYVVGRPYGAFTDMLADHIRKAAQTGENAVPGVPREGAEIVVIGEGISAMSLANAISIDPAVHRSARFIAATELPAAYPGSGDAIARDEDEIIPLLQGAEIIIADPLYRPICPKTAMFIGLGHEGFSGRLFRDSIPDLTEFLGLAAG